MSEYKKGDKFIIEIAEVLVGAETQKSKYRIKGFDSLVFDDKGIQILKQHNNLKEEIDKAYSDGYKAAVKDRFNELAKEANSYTPYKIGDEFLVGGKNYVTIEVLPDNEVKGVDSKFTVITLKTKLCTKTGRNYSAISNLLKFLNNTGKTLTPREQAYEDLVKSLKGLDNSRCSVHEVDTDLIKRMSSDENKKE